MTGTGEFGDRIRARFSRLLREAMTTRHKSVRGLAAEVGVSAKTIQDLRNGTSTPGLDLAAQLANSLGFDLDQVRG